MEQIRILHVVSSLNTGSGVMGVIMNYYRNINRDKVQFDFLYFYQTPSAFEREIKDLGGNTYYLPRPSFGKLFEIYKVYNNFFKENASKYKAVHLHEVYLNFFVLPTARKYGIKQLIAHSHSTKFSDKKLSAIRNLLLCLPIKKQANIYFACSRAAGRTLYGKRRVNSGNVKVINNAIDVNRFKYNSDIRLRIRQELNIDDMFVVGHIGRFAEAKNHDFLLNIFVEIQKKKPDSVLILVGDGPLLKDIKYKAKEYGIESSVRFLGTKRNIEDFVQAMDVFVMPSLFEGLPVTGIEAQAAGLMCFISDTVTKEVAITDVHFLDLTSSASVWAEEIIRRSTDFLRKDTTEKITKAGFNIKREAKMLEEFYLEKHLIMDKRQMR